LNTVTRWRQSGEVEMSALHIFSGYLPSLCQKLSELMESWQSCGRHNFSRFI